jgi:hypothetical protein
VADGTPHHFAAVWDHAAGATGQMSLYIDGVLQGAGAADHPVGIYTVTDFTIGGRSLSGSTYNDNVLPSGSQLDEMRFSNAALAPSEFLFGAAPPANGFANWITGFGLDPGEQGFGADPDGDGLASGVEAYFGTDPSSFDTGLTEVSKSGNVVTFQHPNPTTPLDDVDGSYEWSIDLQTWYAADGVDGNGSTTVNAVATPDDPSANVTTVTASIGGSVPLKIFLRVVATTP